MVEAHPLVTQILAERERVWAAQQLDNICAQQIDVTARLAGIHDRCSELFFPDTDDLNNWVRDRQASILERINAGALARLEVKVDLHQQYEDEFGPHKLASWESAHEIVALAGPRAYLLQHYLKFCEGKGAQAALHLAKMAELGRDVPLLKAHPTDVANRIILQDLVNEQQAEKAGSQSRILNLWHRISKTAAQNLAEEFSGYRWPTLESGWQWALFAETPATEFESFPRAVLRWTSGKLWQKYLGVVQRLYDSLFEFKGKQHGRLRQGDLVFIIHAAGRGGDYHFGGNIQRVPLGSAGTVRELHGTHCLRIELKTPSTGGDARWLLQYNEIERPSAELDAVFFASELEKIADEAIVSRPQSDLSVCLPEVSHKIAETAAEKYGIKSNKDEAISLITAGATSYLQFKEFVGWKKELRELRARVREIAPILVRAEEYIAAVA